MRIGTEEPASGFFFKSYAYLFKTPLPAKQVEDKKEGDTEWKWMKISTSVRHDIPD